MLDGYSAAAAARVIGCDYRTVQLWWRRYNDAVGMEDAPRAGRPRVLSAEDDRRIIEYATVNRFCTVGEIKVVLDLTCDKATIYR